jgi:hypothetical protein
MNTPTTQSGRWLKWTLFVVLLLTVPVPYYMLVVGGIVPTMFIIFISMQGLIIALPKFTAEGFWLLGILWAHVLILGSLLYLAAYVITRVLFYSMPNPYALWVVICLIAALLITSTFEIYRMPGHNSTPPANILRVYKGLVT